MSFALIASAVAVLASGAASPLRDAAEFRDCRWGLIRAGGLSLGAFACPTAKGTEHLVGDPRLPGFWLEGRSDGKPYRRLALRIFAKVPAAPLAAILPAVRAASPGPRIAACSLYYEPKETPEGSKARRYVLRLPTGAQRAWDAGPTAEQDACGPLGVAMVGDRYFEVPLAHPDHVVFVDAGSEIQIFDPQTLTIAPAR